MYVYDVYTYVYSWIEHLADFRQRLKAPHLRYRLAYFFDCSGMVRP